MGYNFSNDKPIFMQLAEVIKSQIVSGKLLPCEKLSSVRDFAIDYGVNPNTVQKALQILEDEGLIYTDRTNGKFVSESKDKISVTKKQIIKQEINLFFEKMKTMGLTESDIIKIINEKGSE